MAFASLFTLLDDITAMLDDVAVMTKVAAKKTTALVGDDLALNAEQVTGVQAERELPVVWAVAKGSMVNKAILVPLAILISYFIPSLISYLLMIGGAYLCFEGVEKIAHSLHKITHSEKISKQDAPPQSTQHILTPEEEKAKIKGAIRTDFILSAEIIVIPLDTVSQASLLMQIIVLSIIGFGITAVVYGLVGGIVKLDDLGLWLMKKTSQIWKKLGYGIIKVMPYFMRLLSFVGTIAMFLVGGGIIAHNLTLLHHLLESMNLVDGWGFILATLIIGLILGAIVLLIVKLFSSIFAKEHSAEH